MVLYNKRYRITQNAQAHRHWHACGHAINI